MDRTEKAKIEAAVRERTELSVVPIYNKVGLKKHDHLGSAVLVKAGDTYCVASAAHVLAEFKNGPLFMPGRPFFRLKGQVRSTCKLDPEIARDDGLDLAWLWLDKEQVAAVEAHGSRFYDLENGNVDERMGDLGTANCVTVGFHESASGVVPGSTDGFFAATFLVSELASEERLSRHGFSPATQIGVPFEGRVYDTLDKRLLRPHPSGMSGGGVWVHSDGKYRLAGIVIEFYSGKSLLIATRFMQILKLLAEPPHITFVD